MKIERISIQQIRPAPYNPRKQLQPDDEEYQKLQRSLEEFGYVDPLIWNRRTGHLIGGHQRYQILLAKGVKEVECSVVDLDGKKEKILNVALNKIDGVWDDHKLASLFAMMDLDILEQELTGFHAKEIEHLVQFDKKTMEQVIKSKGEIPLDEFDDDQFLYECPKCKFKFNP